MHWVFHPINHCQRALDLPSIIAHRMGAFEDSKMTARPGASKVSGTKSVRHGKALPSCATNKYAWHGYPPVGCTRGDKHPRAQRGVANEEDREKATKMLEKNQDHVAENGHGPRASKIPNDPVPIRSDVIKFLEYPTCWKELRKIHFTLTHLRE
ncbi:hypothetical protein PAXINDRAFT_10412 [Paxillus involutus ATCC 200175]|nr:hypothetical protein PAXINDRAFT_10412 [Paxillus involutus ATCC 200175]